MSETPLPRWLVIDRWTHRQVGEVYADTKPEAERAAQRLGHSLTSHRLVPVLALPTTPRRRRGRG